MLQFFKLMVVGAIALSSPKGDSAPTPVTSAQPEVVTIPFNPPLNEPLLYRMTVDQTRNGRPVTRSLEMRVTFTRDGADYVMTAAYLLPAGMPAADPATAVLMRPLALRVSSQGEIVGIVDEAGYWTAMVSIIDDMARHVGGDRQAAEMMRGVIQSMRNMPDEARLALVARNISPIVEYSAAEMRLHEVLEGSIEVESAFGPIIQDVQTSLTGASDSEASVQASYRFNPDQMGTLIRNLQARFGRAPEASDPALQAIQVERRDTYRISLRTGLTEQHDSIITAIGGINDQTQEGRRTQRLVRIR